MMYCHRFGCCHNMMMCCRSLMCLSMMMLSSFCMALSSCGGCRLNMMSDFLIGIDCVEYRYLFYYGHLKFLRQFYLTEIDLVTYIHVMKHPLIFSKKLHAKPIEFKTIYYTDRHPPIRKDVKDFLREF